MSEEMKKAALVEEGQPVSNETTNTQKDYHKDTELSNERDRALEWLHKMAEAAKNFKFEDGIGAYLLYGGVHVTGIREFAERVGIVLTAKETSTSGLYEESFDFENVKFYELFNKEG